jgi:glycolate oxidase iron-sulfur subunit
VRYGRLVDIGRNVVERQVGRSTPDALKRQALRATVPHATVFGSLHKVGQLARPLLPDNFRRKLGDVAPAGVWPSARHERQMLVLDGCVQPSFSPNTNAATARVLDRIGISLVRAPNAGCCGAVSYHLTAQEEGLDYMRRNIDAWWPYVEQGIEAIVMTASGCGVTVKEYGELLAHDPAYASKAARVSELTRDISEIVATEKDKVAELAARAAPGASRGKIAFHAPCTLQHGLKMPGKVEALLTDLGFELTPVPDAHLCCGSAGTYSLLQPELSQRLLANKIAALTSGSPQSILTANIGCQTHLQSATGLPVRHWIEAVDQLTAS